MWLRSYPEIPDTTNARRLDLGRRMLKLSTMPTKLDVLHFFLSSPSGLAEERVVVRKVLRNINEVLSPIIDLRCELIEWTMSVYRGFAEDGQAVINAQTTGRYDVFLGLMGNHLGTPTPRAASGTVEEYELARRARAVDPRALEIMWYFKQPGEVAASSDSYNAVLAFKQRVSHDGALYGEFSTSRQFREMLQSHLPLYIRNWRDNRDLAASASNAEGEDLSIRASASVLSHAVALAEANGERCSVAFKSMSALISEWSVRLDQDVEILSELASEMIELSKSNARELTQRDKILRRTANALELMALAANKWCKDFSTESDRAFGAFASATSTLAVLHTELEVREDWPMLFAVLRAAISSIPIAASTAADGVKALSESIKTLSVHDIVTPAARSAASATMRVREEILNVKRSSEEADRTLSALTET